MSSHDSDISIDYTSGSCSICIWKLPITDEMVSKITEIPFGYFVSASVYIVEEDDEEELEENEEICTTDELMEYMTEDQKSTITDYVLEGIRKVTERFFGNGI